MAIAEAGLGPSARLEGSKTPLPSSLGVVPEEVPDDQALEDDLPQEQQAQPASRQVGDKRSRWEFTDTQMWQQYLARGKTTEWACPVPGCGHQVTGRKGSM